MVCFMREPFYKVSIHWKLDDGKEASVVAECDEMQIKATYEALLKQIADLESTKDEWTEINITEGDLG